MVIVVYVCKIKIFLGWFLYVLSRRESKVCSKNLDNRMLEYFK